MGKGDSDVPGKAPRKSKAAKAATKHVRTEATLRPMNAIALAMSQEKTSTQTTSTATPPRSSGAPTCATCP